jgi:type IV pilus assembly protein PilN
VLGFLVSGFYGAQISGQEARNAYLNQQISEMDQAIEQIKELDAKKSDLLARKKVIEELQSNRSQMVHLFDALVRTIPDGVSLTSIKQEGEQITLEGVAQSNARVSTYMRNLETSGWMTKPDLGKIEAKGGNPGLPFVFSLTVQLGNPNAPKDGSGQAADGAPGVAPATPATQPAPAAGASS